MIQYRFFFALCISILSSCIAYAQTNGSSDIVYEKLLEKIAEKQSNLLLATQSSITASYLFGLPEEHLVEKMFFNYNNVERAEMFPEDADDYIATYRDSAALRLANRFLQMGYIVRAIGNANDKLQWAIAVNVALNSFRKTIPSLPKDSAINEITRVVGKYDSGTNYEYESRTYINSMVDYYRIIESYRLWFLAVPAYLKPLAQKEYKAWHDFNEARFALYTEVSSMQKPHRWKPMKENYAYAYFSSERRDVLEVERGVILSGKPYRQKGKTVTAQEWEKWIVDHSVPIDIEDLKEMGDNEYIPSDSIVKERVRTFKSTFSQWMSARRAIANALPKEQRRYYNNLTADIQSLIIDKLVKIVPD